MRTSFPYIKYCSFIAKTNAIFGGNGAPFALIGAEIRMGMGHQSQSVRNESWIWTIDPGPIDEWVAYGLIQTQLHRLGFHGYI